MTEILIRHRVTNVEYAIDSSDFKRGDHSALEDGTPATYEEAGFIIVHQHPSGLPYEAPAARESAPVRAAKADEVKDEAK